MLTRKEIIEGLFRPYTPWEPETMDKPDVYAREWLNYNIGDRVERLTVSEVNGLVQMSFMLDDIWNDYQMGDIISAIEENLKTNGHEIKSINPEQKSKLAYELIVLV